MLLILKWFDLVFLKKDILSENTRYSRLYDLCTFCNQQGSFLIPQDEPYKILNKKDLIRFQTLKAHWEKILFAFYEPLNTLHVVFKTSPELEAALNETHSIDFANHAHFNQVLLKECQSFKNIEFIQVMIQYDFFKYLGYCQILKWPSKLANPIIFANIWFKALLFIKKHYPWKTHYSKILHELEGLRSSLIERIEEKTEEIRQLKLTQKRLKLSHHPTRRANLHSRKSI